LWGVTPYYTFYTTGEYLVNLTISNITTGFNDTDNMNLTIYSIPTAVANGSFYSYVGDEIELNATSSTDVTNIVNYTWVIDGNYYYGNITTVNTTGYILGTYNIVLEVTNALGYKDWDNSSNITLQDMPIANAGVDQTVDEDNIITFDASSSLGKLTNYTWNFTFNGTLVELWGIAPTYNFTTNGTYLVNLTVTDGNYTSYDTMNLTINYVAPTITPTEVAESTNWLYVFFINLIILIIFILILMLIINYIRHALLGDEQNNEDKMSKVLNLNKNKGNK